MRSFFLAAVALAATAAAAAPHHARHAGHRLSPLAERQLAEARAAVAHWQDPARAEADGWKRWGGEDTPLMGEHWVKRDGPDYVHGDRIDFHRPSNLMYTAIGGRRVLTGVAYVVRLGPGEPLPTGFDGPHDEWHVHDMEAALGAALQDRPLLRWLANDWLDRTYRDKGDRRGRLAMVHAWVTLPNPDGPFADHNRALPYLKLGLPAAYAEGASLAAARGLNLATEGGCRHQIDSRIWVANAGRRAAARLRQACAAAAAEVRASLSGTDGARINAAGEAAWRRFDAAWTAVLTPDQRARIAAITEHGAARDATHGAHH